MLVNDASVKYIGGPTALIEIAGIRMITDPTFDAKGSEYKTSLYTLRKLTDPAASIPEIGKVDIVLLSHDHHFDNLDNEGRKFLSTVKTVYTTATGAGRLGGNAIGLKPWETVHVTANNGQVISITGTPCRHGPVNGDRGPVTGFVLNYENETSGGIYVTGDTVWYEGVAEVANHFDVKLILLFLGAATVQSVGPEPLTMTVAESIEVAKHFPDAQIMPLHFEGWEHFTESRTAIEAEFKKAGLTHRLQWAGGM